MLNRKSINLRNLVEHHGADHVQGLLLEAMDKGEIKLNDISVLELAYGFLGQQGLTEMAMRQAPKGGSQLLESAGVDSTAFINITGQIIYNKVMEAYNAPGFIGDTLFTTMQSQFLDGEKIAGITAVQGDGDEDIREGMPYPEATFGEDYVESPATKKKGMILSLTRETVLKDRTGVLMQRAGEIGTRIRVQKEKKQLRVAMGIDNNYKWKGTTYNTFLTSGGWINDASSQELLDWTSIENVFVQLSENANPDQPDSTEPINVQMTHLFVMPYKYHTALRITNATEVRAVSNTNNTTLSRSPIMPLEVVTSALALQVLIASGVSSSNAKNYWFAGDPKKALMYTEIWPVTVTQAPANLESELERDIIARYKASERGVPWVYNPRYIARRYVA